MNQVPQQQFKYLGNYIIDDLKESEKERQRDKELTDEKYSKYFLLFQALIYLFAVVSFGYGNPQLLGVPYDSGKFACGVNVGLEHYPFIYITNPKTDKYLSRTVCVQECPTLTSSDNEADESLLIDCHPNTIISSCQNRPSINDPEYSMLYYSSVPFDKACLPTKTMYLQNVLNAIQQPFIVKFLSDINHGKTLIFSTLCLCLILNLTFYNFTLRKPHVQIWVIGVCSVIALLLSGLMGILFAGSINNYKTFPSTPTVTREQAIGILQAQTVSTTLIFVVSLIFITIGVCVAGLLVFYRNRIRTIGYKLQIINYYFDYSSMGQQQPQKPYENRFTQLNILVLLSSISLLIFAVLWMQVALHLFSIGSPSTERDTLPFQEFTISWIAYFLGIFHFIEFILVALVIVSGGIFIIIGKLVDIYRIFAMLRGNNDLDIRDNNEIVDKDERDLVGIFKIFLKFNIGTVVIGEILILLSAPIRYYLNTKQWIYSKLKKENQFSDWSLKILSYTDRSYLFAYMKNDNFKQSARAQYEMDEELQGQNKLFNHGNLFKLLHCSAISNLCISLTYAMIMVTQSFINLNNPTSILVVVFIFSYMVQNYYQLIRFPLFLPQSMDKVLNSSPSL